MYVRERLVVHHFFELFGHYMFAMCLKSFTKFFQESNYISLKILTVSLFSKYLKQRLKELGKDGYPQQ